jgi:hypothetical protein
MSIIPNLVNKFNVRFHPIVNAKPTKNKVFPIAIRLDIDEIGISLSNLDEIYEDLGLTLRLEIISLQN